MTQASLSGFKGSGALPASSEDIDFGGLPEYVLAVWRPYLEERFRKVREARAALGSGRLADADEVPYLEDLVRDAEESLRSGLVMLGDLRALCAPVQTALVGEDS